MTDETRNQVWDFMRDRTLESRVGALPFAVFLRVFHGWSASYGFPLPLEHDVESALEAAGYRLIPGQRGDWLIKGLRFVPKGQEAPE
ncbi:hypothetical protein [Streptomyces griseoaurantiacus]|uniref:hypothetical protein n=1 Tax=Streptomyces griseoaurantiacus TaxID=68213 RepID=UPI00345F9352